MILVVNIIATWQPVGCTVKPLTTDLDRYDSVSLELIRQALTTSGRLRLHVISNSMRPLMAMGDTVSVQLVPATDLRCGDLIAVEREGTVLTHRLIAVDVQGWHTKGDSNLTADSPSVARSILGRITVVEHQGRAFDLSHARWRWANHHLGRLNRWQARVAHGLWSGADIDVTSRSLRYLWARLSAIPFRVLIRLILWPLMNLRLKENPG